MMEGTIGKVLIVDDDENICEVIKMYLESAGYSIRMCHDGKAAQEAFVDYKPDLVLLDIMIPHVDGIDVLKWIRKDYETPVIMLTAKGDTFDKVLGLELGADDYMVKPFEPKELLARVKAVLRRYNVENINKEAISFEDLVIDVNSYTVVYKGSEKKCLLRNLNCFITLQTIKIEFLQESSCYVKFGDMIIRETQEQ
jgi:DNA-binding response OmpR family regulator